MTIDYKDYPSDWKARSRFIRKFRAKDRCERCGIANGEPTKTGWKVVLTVAHLFDKTKKNGRFLNLAALCQKCHLAHDFEDRMKKGPIKSLPLFLDKSWVKDPLTISDFVSRRGIGRVRRESQSGLWFLHKNFNAPATSNGKAKS